ncbi:MAG: hypothetical protein HY709_06495 [Candidatus Latescibacteria bacterium]|nr:hypothetical protein [Candidatus Latescibacterota bacterium]
MADFIPEGSETDIKTLNVRLESQGHPTFSDNFFSLGGDSYKILNWVVSGGEGHGSLRREALTTTGIYKVSLSGGYGFLNVEYLVYSMESLSVYPLLGFGGRVRFKLVERLREFLPFEVLENPKTGGFLVNAALGTDGLLKLREDEKGKGGFIVGLCVGYTFTPVKGDLAVEETNISDGPLVGITGPYVRVMLGGGRIGRK